MLLPLLLQQVLLEVVQPLLLQPPQQVCIVPACDPCIMLCDEMVV